MRSRGMEVAIFHPPKKKEQNFSEIGARENGDQKWDQKLSIVPAELWAPPIFLTNNGRVANVVHD